MSNTCKCKLQSCQSFTNNVHHQKKKIFDQIDEIVGKAHQPRPAPIPKYENTISSKAKIIGGE